MNKKNIIFAILLTIMTACLTFGLIACNGGEKRDISLSFDDGESITVIIGEKRMLSFTASEELSETQKATIVSSNRDVIETDSRGYITAVGKGTAELILSVEGISNTAKIAVTVTVPQNMAENFYYINVDSQKYTNLFIDLDGSVPIGASLYVETYRDDALLSSATTTVLSNRRAYVPLDAIKATDGIYKVGIGCLDADELQVKNVYLTDVNKSYSFVEGESWSYIWTQMENDGAMVLDKRYNYGCASMVLDVETDSDGVIVNPFVNVRVSSGNMWSVKLRKGASTEVFDELVVLKDTPVSERSVCQIDLNDYTQYVDKEQITIVIYTLYGNLTVEEIVNYSKENDYSIAVRESGYKALEQVDIRVADQLFVGQEYAVGIDFTPAKASFKDMKLVASNENVTVLENGKIFIDKPGECELTYVGYDGTVYGRLTVHGSIKITEIGFVSNAGGVVLETSAGSYSLADIVQVYPSNANKAIVYELISTTSTDATVSEEGVVSFTNTGVIRVKLTAKENVNVKKEFVLTVVDGFIKSEQVEIGGGAEALRIGDTLSLTAIITPQNATYHGVVWESSNCDVATVENGVVTAKKAGTVTVFAFAEDGASFDSLTVQVKALKDVSFDTTQYTYGSIELSNDILSGDEVIVNVYRGSERATLVQQMITEAETASHSVGNMEVQRRILFGLTHSIFIGNADYTFELLVNRNGQPLQGYAFGKLTVGKATQNITEGEWTKGYYDCEPSLDSGAVVATLVSDGWGNISQTVSSSMFAGAQYLIVRVSDKTAGMLSVKMMIGDTEIRLTEDCSSTGVYKIDLREYADQLASASEIKINLYAIGESGTAVTFDQIFFVTEETQA